MNKIASVKTINGQATVTVDTAESHEVIDVPNGACLVMVKGEGGGNEEPEPEPNKYLKFADMIGAVDGILRECGHGDISDLGTPMLYNYLLKAWNKADAEWKKADSWLFDGATYPDIAPWHGVVKDYETEAYNSLQAWLMAMLVAELVPTTGTTTNTQTKLFKLAYEIGGGRVVPVYGLDIHCDPMVSRLAAGALYAMIRSGYSYADIDSMRSEIGGTTINASDWNGLNYKGSDGKMQACGFLVNSDIIIPAAPGPFADGCDNNRVKPWEQGQPIEQFDMAGGNYDWDVDIDSFTVEQFNMGAQTPLAIWNGYDEATRKRIMNVCAVARATDHFFFGKKFVHFDGVKNGTRAGNCKDYLYYWFSEVAKAGADTYEIGGPFADLYSKMFTGSGFGTKTNAMLFFDKVLDIADNSRYPTFHDQYGRIRPCGGATLPSSARSDVNGSPLNALYNVDLACIFADTQAERDKWSQENGFVAEKPKSYPSGHSTMTMTVALMLGQMTGDADRLRKYMTEAYTVSINRTIGRAHWNSDVIYGRLFATFALPIINAMKGMRDGYEQTKNAVNGSEPSYEGTVAATVTIKNQSGKSITHDGKVCFITYGTDPRGTGYKGYFRFRGNCSGNDFTIANGQSKTYNVTFVADDDPKVGVGMPFASSSQRGKYKSNNCYYVGNNGMTCTDFPSSDTFRDGGKYAMTIPTGTKEWTS